MTSGGVLIAPVIQPIHLPAGVAGETELDFDVRCFVIRHRSGLVLLDAGLPGSGPLIELVLKRLGAGWTDVTDVVITHGHPDHIGGLNEVSLKAPNAIRWAGMGDVSSISSPAPIRPLREGQHVQNLRIIATPGHTEGHVSLLHEGEGILFVGDAIGTVTGELTRGPAHFTADAEEAERSLERLSTLQATRMLFSHGPEIEDPGSRLKDLVAKGPDI